MSRDLKVCQEAVLFDCSFLGSVLPHTPFQKRDFHIFIEIMVDISVGRINSVSTVSHNYQISGGMLKPEEEK